ncbi:MAG: hypothetical protein ACJ0K4_03195 [Verrucomicrobiales bacterium]|nr:MAG: hypothetical protein EVB09_00520 [Verrucomicrobiaceae bacterium]|tara:strand:- start:212 stop:910 length:699 start_codon:yes stop_codon:yes gene_type:complete
MKKISVPAVLLTVILILSQAIQSEIYSYDGADQVSRTVVHKDGTYTTTQRNRDTRILVRETKKRNNTLIMRSEFALDEKGRERKGRVYDGQNNLLFISEFVYDNDELIEERVFDSKGKVVRRLLYKVKVVSKLDGRSRPALVSYQNGKPIGDLVALDDPGVFSTTSHNAHSSKKSAEAGANGFVRSKDGKLVPLPQGAVQYPGAGAKPVLPGSASEKKSKPKRKLRIFKRRS